MFFPQRPQPRPICCECLGTGTPSESLISCYGCGASVHPSCRVYSADLAQHFQRHGWTCDDCKVCIVCAKTQKNVRKKKKRKERGQQSDQMDDKFTIRTALKCA